MLSQEADERLEQMLQKYKNTKNNLPKVDLKDCQLTELPVVLRSEQESQFYRKVIKLNLANNPLLFSSSSFCISHLKDSLSELCLASNQLNHVPEGLGEFSKLRSLNLMNNNITELPDWFFDASKCHFQQTLTILTLERNAIEVIPAQISQFTALEVLQLHKNKVKSLPYSITQLPQLKDITISNNPLKKDALERLDDEPESTGEEKELYLFTKLKNMKFFSINGASNIKRLPNEICNWKKLEFLNAYNCSLNYVPLYLIVENMKNLRHLVLKGNKLGDDTFIDPRTHKYVDLSVLKNLTEIEIRKNNNMTHLPPYLHKGVVRQTLPRLKKFRHSFAECIIPKKLFIGDKHSVQKAKHMRDLGITHILSVIDNENLPSLPSPNIKRLHIDVLDETSVDLSIHFDRAVQFIEEALMEPDSAVLVHCVVGKSRSASCVLAYLMKTYSLTYPQSFAVVNSIRSGGIAPNESFVSQLRLYESRLTPSENTVTMSESDIENGDYHGNTMIQSVIRCGNISPKIIEALDTIYRQSLTAVKPFLDAREEMEKPKEVASPQLIEEFKMVLLVRDDLNMTKGKVTSQCCHATLGAYRSVVQSNNEQQLEWLKQWESIQETKVGLRVKDAYELEELIQKASDLGLNTFQVVDKGRTTQVDSGSVTAAAIGPAPSSLIDQITKSLKLI